MCAEGYLDCTDYYYSDEDYDYDEVICESKRDYYECEGTCRPKSSPCSAAMSNGECDDGFAKCNGECYIQDLLT